MNWFEAHILSIITFLPMILAGGVLWLPERGAKLLGIGGSFFVFLLSLYVWYIFDGSSAQLQLVESYEWLPSLGIRYIVGIDGLSLLLVVLSCFLTPLILLSIWDHKENVKSFMALLLALETGMVGALVAFDMVFFYVFWEVMLVPMYFIIGIWGGKNRVYATTKFVIYTVFGSLLMLIAAIAIYINHYEQFGIYSTSLLDLYQTNILASEQTWLFAAFALAFAIKVPIWPFHTWLPDAHTEAPTAGSVILAGVLLKMGTYGFLRFAIPLFPAAIATYGPLFMTLGIIGIIYGALIAWMQPDAKKMVAYSSVSHLGFVVIGSVAAIGPELSKEALTGAVYQMISHGITTGALFFLVGVIYERRHTRMLSDYGGIAKVMPWFAVMLIVATLGSVGLPGTGGFVGEFLILLGVFKSNIFAGIAASLGVLLGAIYMLTLCRKILFGPVVHKENEALKDLSIREFAYLIPLALLVVAMGVFPNFFLSKIRPSIDHLAETYQNYRLYVHVPTDHDQNSVSLNIGQPFSELGKATP
jgi:NADH-quinone oxidoreductase subunit M